MNRSLRELKFCFMVGLPLLCAGRAVERLNLFLFKPIAVQEKVFGRVEAYPWQLREADSWANEDGVGQSWRYRLPAFPKPLPRCKAEDWPMPGNAQPTGPNCGLASTDGYLKAGWESGALWMRYDPFHHDPSASKDDIR